MLRLWLELLSLLLLKDLVMLMGFQGKHKKDKPLIFKSPAQRSNRDISNHISPNGEVKPRQEGEDIRPHLQLPQGFDPSTGQQQEDGQFCVFKKLSLEGLYRDLTTVIIYCGHCQVLRRFLCSSAYTGWTPSVIPHM